MRVVRIGLIGFVLSVVSGVVTACVGDDPGNGTTQTDAGDSGTTLDASRETGDLVDATTAACDPDRPFGVPQLLSSLSSTFAEGSAALSLDQRTGYVSRLIGARAEILRGTRAQPGDPFGQLTPLFSTNDFGVAFPSITADDLHLYYQAVPTDGGVSEIHLSRRQNPSVSFELGAAISVAPLISGSAPSISADGSALYFLGQASAGQQPRVYRMVKNGNAFGAPELQLDPVPAPAAIGSAVVSSDELTIYITLAYGSQRSDIYRARRGKKTDAFSAVERVDVLSDPNGAEGPVYLSPDGCVMLLVTDRPGSIGPSFDVFEARRPR
jgi:hypothetical protein